jgi:hypothetical protein
MAGLGFGTQIPPICAKLCHEVSDVIFASLRFIALAKKFITETDEGNEEVEKLRFLLPISRTESH